MARNNSSSRKSTHRDTGDAAYERQKKRLEMQSKRLEKAQGAIQSTSNRAIVVTPKTDAQRELMHALETYAQVFVFGPAGVGKTYVTVSHAAKEYKEGRIKKIVITRPNVGTGNTIGLLPGDINEKMGAWLAESVSILKRQLGQGAYEIALSNGDIEMVPLETIRGRSFSASFILVTEAQNLTVEETTSLVTRVGEGSTLVLDGDVRQTDIKGTNGLSWALDKVNDNDELFNQTGIIEFSINDVVRSGLCASWVKALWG